MIKPRVSGFQPWEPSVKRFALKGQENAIRLTDTTQMPSGAPSYLYSADHTARRRQDSLAQGSPWVSQQNVLCPEGAGGIEMCMRSDLEPILAVPNGPFRAYCGGGKFTQG
jgi:hypothetical protein